MKNLMLLVTVAIKSEKKISVSKLILLVIFLANAIFC